MSSGLFSSQNWSPTADSSSSRTQTVVITSIPGNVIKERVFSTNFFEIVFQSLSNWVLELNISCTRPLSGIEYIKMPAMILRPGQVRHAIPSTQLRPLKYFVRIFRGKCNFFPLYVHHWRACYLSFVVRMCWETWNAERICAPYSYIKRILLCDKIECT